MDDVTQSNVPGMGFAGSAAKAGWLVEGPFTSGERRTIAPFSLMTDGTATFMYVPAKSVTVNGKAFTPTGLTAHDLTDWYVVTSFTSGLNLYVDFSDDDSLAGKPLAAVFAASTPYTGQYLEVPVLACADGVFSSLAFGGIYLERTGVDSQGDAATMKSIAKPSGAGWTDEDHTIEVHGFRNATAPDEDPFAESASRTQHIGVRETVSGGGGAEMRWYNLRTLISTLQSTISDYVLDNIPDPVMDYSDWKTWYDALEDGYFWEKGADYTVNYGSSIGSSESNKVIDLSSQTLEANGYTTVDWANRTMYDSTGAETVDWENAHLIVLTTGTEISLNWSERMLYAGASADWGTDGNFLLDTGMAIKVNGIQVLTDQQAAVADASGGSTVDAEARTAINDLLARLRAHGLIAT